MRMRLSLIVLLVLAAGCASGLKRPVQEVTAKAGADGVQRVRIEAHSYYFSPNRIVVKANLPVELTVKQSALFVPHNFTCIAPNAGVDVKRGLGMLRGSKHLRFIPTTPGEYPFFCAVGSHAKKGMTGTLVVVP